MAVVLWSSPGAWALLADSTTASASYSTATLAAPTASGASAGTCVALVGDRIVVNWTATASTWAAGYEIARSTASGGPYSVIGTVSGRSTTSYNDGPLSFSTTYHYVVRAAKGAWRSIDSAQVSRTTRTALCA